jgi:hypothetical protein
LFFSISVLNASTRTETIVSETNRFQTDRFFTAVNVVTLDITFHGDGLCLSRLQAHTLPLTLRDMVGDPIRLGKSDLGSFELHSRMAMEGSVPVVVARGRESHAVPLDWIRPRHGSISQMAAALHIQEWLHASLLVRSPYACLLRIAVDCWVDIDYTHPFDCLVEDAEAFLDRSARSKSFNAKGRCLVLIVHSHLATHSGIACPRKHLHMSSPFTRTVLSLSETAG